MSFQYTDDPPILTLCCLWSNNTLYSSAHFQLFSSLSFFSPQTSYSLILFLSFIHCSSSIPLRQMLFTVSHTWCRVRVMNKIVTVPDGLELNITYSIVHSLVLFLSNSTFLSTVSYNPMTLMLYGLLT